MIGTLAALATGFGLERLLMWRLHARPERVEDADVRLPDDVRHRFLDSVDGGAIHLVERGEGPVVLLLHGVTMAAPLWAPQFRLAEQGRRIVAVDLTGHDRSTVGSRGTGVEADAARLAELLARPEFADAVVVGHSMGGMGLATALAEGVRPRHAVFLSTAGRLPGHVRGPLVLRRVARRLARLIERNPILADRVQRVPPNDLGELAIRTVFGAAPSRRHLRLTAELYDRLDTAIWLEASASMLGYDVLDRLGSVDVPATVVVGSHDRLTPPTEAARLHEALGGPRELIVVPEVGHQLMLERPDVLDDLILRLTAASPEPAAEADELG